MLALGYLLAFLYGALVIALGALAYRLGLPKPYCRKLVHILIGGELCILSHFFGTSLHMLLVALLFTGALLLNYKKRLLPMMASDADNDPGTLYYGVSMSSLALAVYFLPDTLGFFGAAVLVTSLGDGLAGLVGQSIEKYNPKLFGKKTLLGSCAMLLSSGVALTLLREPLGLTEGHALALALFATGLELLCRRGTDNLAVPLGAYAFLCLCTGTAVFSGAVLSVGALPLCCVVFLSRRALSSGGTVAAALVALCLMLALGDAGLVFLLLYFALAYLADRVARRRPNAFSDKGECRDLSQVLANGFFGALAALLYAISGERVLLVATVAAFAESLADTSASGFGALARRTFDPFHLRLVERGQSGGVSFVGTLASALCALALSFLGVLLFGLSVRDGLFCALAAFVGMLLDSVLGALWQEKRRCPVCSRLTERATHCEHPTEHALGLPFLDNDLVNLLCTLAAALLALGVASLGS